MVVVGTTTRTRTEQHIWIFPKMAMVWKGMIDAVQKGTPKYNL
jgi:hypothetical protein